MISPRNMEVELNSTSAFSMCSWNWKDRTGNFWAAVFCSKYIYIYIERERESQSQREEEGRREDEQRGRNKGQRRKESLLQWFLDSIPTPSSMPLKGPAALCRQGTPTSWQQIHLYSTHLFLKLLTGFCCLQSNESPPRPLRTLTQVKERNSSALRHVFPKETL